MAKDCWLLKTRPWQPSLNAYSYIVLAICDMLYKADSHGTANLEVTLMLWASVLTASSADIMHGINQGSRVEKQHSQGKHWQPGSRTGGGLCSFKAKRGGGPHEFPEGNRIIRFGKDKPEGASGAAGPCFQTHPSQGGT